MIQNFLFPASPGTARRIMQLAKRVRVAVDPAIEALAATGLISNEEFDSSPVLLSESERQMAQFMLDCQLRGLVLSHDRHSFYGLAHAVRLADAFPLVIYTTDDAVDLWCQFGRDVGWDAAVLDKRYRPSPEHKMVVLPVSLGLHADAIRDTRHGTMLIDVTAMENSDVVTLPWDMIGCLGIDYPRTIISLHTSEGAEPTSARHHGLLLLDLFPYGCLDTMVRGEKRDQRELVERGFRNPHPKSMAPLANISTHLLP